MADPLLPRRPRPHRHNVRLSTSWSYSGLILTRQVPVPARTFLRSTLFLVARLAGSRPRGWRSRTPGLARLGLARRALGAGGRAPHALALGAGGRAPRGFARSGLAGRGLLGSRPWDSRVAGSGLTRRPGLR